MMMLWRLIFRNTIKHKMSSMVFVLVFSIATLIIYWFFGFFNYLIENVEILIRDGYGDIAFQIDYTDKNKIQHIIKNLPPEMESDIKETFFEREIRVMVDGQDKSTVVPVIEMTEQNKNLILKHIRPQYGQFPSKSEEIVVSSFNQSTTYKLGDDIFLTTSTTKRIINALKFRVSGIIRGSAGKAYGYGYIISKHDMDLLLNSSDEHNLFYLFLKEDHRSAKEVTDIQNKIIDLLKANNITLQSSWSAYKTINDQAIYFEVFKRMKLILLVFIFPLIGLVVAAIVWMYSYKRRKEIWTYHSLGLQKYKIILAIGGEYLLITFIGTLIGLALGEMSALIADKNNAWLSFSYTVSTALRFKFTLVDYFLVSAFMQIIVILWIEKPISRILKVPPFSF
ncbi:MAG: FtsX-like permease family protein [Oligoflexia bacterium]|nr:FtsX-like permease family protein [Oligoflexia bacterium]